MEYNSNPEKSEYTPEDFLNGFQPRMEKAKNMRNLTDDEKSKIVKDFFQEMSVTATKLFISLGVDKEFGTKANLTTSQGIFRMHFNFEKVAEYNGEYGDVKDYLKK